MQIEFVNYLERTFTIYWHEIRCQLDLNKKYFLEKSIQ